VIVRKRAKLALVAAILMVAAMSPGCSRKASAKPRSIKLDYAYYNPVSLVLKDKKFLEQDLASDGISVEWTQSLGSNKALELLNSKSVDFGSTAGAAALIGKANGNPIKAIYVYSRPEWTALVVRKDSPIAKVEDLKGKKVAVTRGTDPHIFLLRALHEAGLTEKDIQMVVLQHPEGRIALEKGDVDAWAGLDPMMAQTEIQSGSRLFYRNVNFNSYGVLNVREEFAQQYPAYVERVLDAYEKARLWALQNPHEFRKLFATDTKLDDSVITKVLGRTDLTNSTIGDNQRQVILAAGDVLKQNNVINSSTDVSATVTNLIDPRYAQDVVNKSVAEKMSTVEQHRRLVWKDADARSTSKPPDNFGRIYIPDRLLGWIIPVSVLLLWELLARLGVLPPNWLPAPTVVGKTIYQLAAAGDLWKHAEMTVSRVAIGFLIGASAGTLFGGLTGYLPIARKLLDPSLQALRSVPSIAWVPLFLLWLGIQETSKIALISVGAFFPVYLNLSVAMRHVDTKLLEVGKLYRLSRFQMVRRLILPAVLPEFIVGLRSGLGLTWMFVVAAELLGASSGIGYLMVDGEMTGRAAVILASVILFAVFGKTTDWMRNTAGRRLLGHRAR